MNAKGFFVAANPTQKGKGWNDVCISGVFRPDLRGQGQAILQIVHCGVVWILSKLCPLFQPRISLGQRLVPADLRGSRAPSNKVCDPQESSGWLGFIALIGWKLPHHDICFSIKSTVSLQVLRSATSSVHVTQ